MSLLHHDAHTRVHAVRIAVLQQGLMDARSCSSCTTINIVCTDLKDVQLAFVVKWTEDIRDALGTQQRMICWKAYKLESINMLSS
jgi:hypothetical protein